MKLIFWWHHEEERLKPLFFCFTLYFNKIQRFSFLPYTHLGGFGAVESVEVLMFILTKSHLIVLEDKLFVMVSSIF